MTPHFSDAQRQLLKTKDALIEMEAQANNTNNDQLIAKYEIQLDTVRACSLTDVLHYFDYV